MSSVIETDKLTKLYGDLLAVKDLSISVESGEILGFLGPNGAGKTTTTRILSGLIAPSSGHAVVSGMKTDRTPELLHEKVGILTETPGFYERMTALENLLYFGGFYEIDQLSQAEKYLNIMGLSDRKQDKVTGFSRGMLQKLALARALIHEPEIVFLDEPTAGLDPEASIEIRNLIRDLKNRGHTVFLTTHNLEEAETLSDRIALIRTRLLVLDTVKNLKNQLFKPQVTVELESVNKTIMNAVKGLKIVKNVQQEKNILHIDIDDPESQSPILVKRIVEAGGDIRTVSEKHHTLEDVYLSLIREEKEKVDESD
ncbi:MAG: ABC transporter ATP-binding protein [Spirochaetota bacterium]|nr:MAG: ABC transporter ATP-binding protein [Spirochaetota bacterium]